MRILHIGKYYPPVPGGMERYLGDLIAAQRAAGIHAAALVHGEPGRRHADDPAWLMRCPVWGRCLFAPVSPSFPFWLARAITRHRPDLLHIHMPNPSAFWALLLPAARRIGWVVHWHADVETGRFPWSMRLAYILYRVFERAMLERAALIVVTSRNYLESSRPLRPWRDKCRVVPLGVDPTRLPDVPPAETRGLWRGQQTLRVLAIGRLTYYKGFDTLIRAVARNADAELVLVGEGEERRALERVWQEEGASDRIRLAGPLEDADCRRLLASCDVLCLPSRERTEAFGVVLMEAMRYGKPVLASDLRDSGVAWVVKDGDNGLLVSVDDVPAWMRALRTLQQDPACRTTLGEAGRRRYWREFDIARGARRLARLYAHHVDTVAAPRPGRAAPLIVIPALNEAASIGLVIEQARAAGIGDVLVVDDGSQDETAPIALASGAVVLRPALTQGAWGAMQTGIRYAVKHGYAGVITMDADGQHEAGYLGSLLAAGRTADVVIGACPQRGSRLRRLAWAYFRLLTGFNYQDLTSGLRYYGPAACRLLAGKDATLLDYQDIGVMLLIRAAGLTAAEVPVAMNSRRNGASRIFYSWGTVARYMLETTVLCLANWRAGQGRHG